MKKLEKLNELVKHYNGQIANWKSRGGKGSPPAAIVSLMEDMDVEIIKFLVSMREKVA